MDRAQRLRDLRARLREELRESRESHAAFVREMAELEARKQVILHLADAARRRRDSEWWIEGALRRLRESLS